VSREFGRPVVEDAHPKYAVALGAASIAAASMPALPAPRGGHGSDGPALRVDGVRSAPPITNGAPTGPGWKVADVPAPRPPAADAVPVGAPARPVSAESGSGVEPETRNGAAVRAAGASLDEPTEMLRVRRPVPDPPTRPRNPRSRVRIGRVPLAAVAAVVVLGLALVYVLGPWRTAADSPTGVTSTLQPNAAPATTPPPTSVPPSPSIAQPTVAGAFRVAAGPQAGAVTPDGKLAYVTSTGKKVVSVVDLSTNTVVAEIPIAAGPPVYVAFTPDGSRAYVSVHDEASKTGNDVVVVDTETRTVTATIPAESYPYALAVSPNGRQVYVPNHDADLISVIDTATDAVVNKITVKPNPHSVAFSVDGRRAYVANHASNLVTVLDTKNGAMLAEIPVGRSPHSVAMSPDSSRVYVVNYDADSVAVIDPASNTVAGTIPVQREPQSVKFAPDGKHAYIVNDGSNTVSVIDTETSQVTATLGVGQTPTDVFIAPDGRHAYVTNISSNDVTVLNIAG
jgi:YVTN family beta-propeller protein